MNKIYLFLLLLVACSAAPVKDFHTIQYLPQDGNCHDRLLADGTVEELCYFDDGDKDWITIRKSFFNKELNYQDLLIRSCKKWRR